MTELAEGVIVTDKEQGPQEGVVIFLPDGDLTDWNVLEEDGTEITVADKNPGYDDDQRVVIVAWKDDIEEKLKWKNIEPGRLFQTCCKAGVRWYAFPENRLEVEKDVVYTPYKSSMTEILQDKTVDEVRQYVEGVLQDGTLEDYGGPVPFLEAVEEAEKEGKNRKGVLELVDKKKRGFE